jgi:hypothetical protein
MCLGRLIRILVCSIALAGPLFVPTAFAEPGAAAIEYKLKAVFLLNFTKFIEWPAQAFSGETAPIVICIAGMDPFGRVLDEAVEGETVQGRALEIKRLSLGQDLRACHIAFFGRSTASRLAELLPGLRGSHTLTVGEMENGFLQQGGAMNFVLVDQKVRFEVNPDIATRANLKISSKLLVLAYRQE